MFWNARNGTLEIDGGTTDYIAFGSGKHPLIILPGLSDGLRTVKGTAVPFSVSYRIFARRYRVFVFSRRNDMPKHYSTREMAADIYKAMVRLGIRRADVIGVSMGGMIAQYLAIDHPECVHKLVLAVTLSKPNDTIRRLEKLWTVMAEDGNYRVLMIDTAHRSYTEEYLKRNGNLIKLSSKIGKPDDFSRFITMAHACGSHNAYDQLHKIKCPTLIIGGNKDNIVTGQASTEIAERINNSTLFMYEQYGHALYEEASDFNERIMDFLTERTQKNPCS